MGVLRKFAFVAAFGIALSAGAEPLAVRVDEFDAPSVGRRMKMSVVVPADYDAPGNKRRYPVLYLLHGLMGDYTSWVRNGVPFYAQFHDMIIVMPDAGNSWYVNWSRSDGEARNDWEDYIVRDVIGYVEANYRVEQRAAGRALAGVSMGGYGALALGLRHPEMFCAIGSQSGAFDYSLRAARKIEATGTTRISRKGIGTEPQCWVEIEGFNSQALRTPHGEIFETVEQAVEYCPFALIQSVARERLPYVYLDCGRQDPLSSLTRRMLAELVRRDADFTFAQSAGGHEPDYWLREVKHMMTALYQVMEHELGRQSLTREEAGAIHARSITMAHTSGEPGN